MFPSASSTRSMVPATKFWPPNIIRSMTYCAFWSAVRGTGLAMPSEGGPTNTSSMTIAWKAAWAGGAVRIDRAMIARARARSLPLSGIRWCRFRAIAVLMHSPPRASGSGRRSPTPFIRRNPLRDRGKGERFAGPRGRVPCAGPRVADADSEEQMQADLDGPGVLARDLPGSAQDENAGLHLETADREPGDTDARARAGVGADVAVRIEVLVAHAQRDPVRGLPVLLDVADPRGRRRLTGLVVAD